MKPSQTPARTRLDESLQQLIAVRGSNAIGDLGDYLLARLLATGGERPARERAAEIAGISGLHEALDTAHAALRDHHERRARTRDWGRDLVSAALSDCGRASGYAGRPQEVMMDEAAGFALVELAPELARRWSVAVRIPSDPTGLLALTIHDALVEAGISSDQEISRRLLFDIATTSPDLSNLAYAQLSLSDLVGICRCRADGLIMQPDARTPAWRDFARMNGTGMPHVMTFATGHVPA